MFVSPRAYAVCPFTSSSNMIYYCPSVEHVVRAIKFGGAGHFDRGPGAAFDSKSLDTSGSGTDVDVVVARYARARRVVDVREYRRCHRQVRATDVSEHGGGATRIVFVVLGVGDAPAVVAAQELEALDETRFVHRKAVGRGDAVPFVGAFQKRL